MTDQPFFHRTGGDNFPDKLKVLLSGPPKSGKTTFLGTVPGIVVADTEPHANNLMSIAHKNVPYITVFSQSDLQRLRFVLADDSLRAKAAAQMGMPAIEAVAIDTTDTLQQILKKERTEANKGKFLRDDWGWLKDEMTQIIRSFTALPLHVIFTVHTKTKELGSADDTRSITAPGLQGSIDEEIAGMVGYSLGTFRREELRADGSKFTKYWLRAEGDENNPHLGNRAAGQLPDIIEPSFAALAGAAARSKAAAAAAQTAAPAAAPQERIEIQTTGETAPAAEVAQTPGQTEQVETPSAAPAAAAAPKLAGEDEPLNANVMQHLNQVFAALGASDFSEDWANETIKTIGNARQVVRYWRASQADHAQGTEADPVATTKELLDAHGWLPASLQVSDAAEPQSQPEAAEIPAADQPVTLPVQDAGVAEQVPAPTTAPPAITPNPEGTMPEVMAWVGDDRERAQTIFDAEMKRATPRKTLLGQLQARGATAPVQTPVETPQEAPATPAEAVTPSAPAADASPTQDEAITTVEEGLGGTVVSEDPDVCAECGGPIDDPDIADLSKARFGKRLDVAHYIAQTKK